MPKILTTIILFLTSFFHNLFFNLEQLAGPCQKPVTFSIARIDPGFNLVTDTAIVYIKDAGNLWNKGTGKDLMEYDPNGDVIVSFIYDERQRQTIKKKILEETIKNQKIVLKVKSSDINLKESNFLAQKNVYQSQVVAFNQRLAKYNSQVEQINNSGGATQAQSSDLEAEKNYLDTQQVSLENTRNQLNDYLNSLNYDVTNYNKINNQVNQVINQVNKNVGSEFEEGVYTNSTITLYQYENILDLKRLLAHEMGHALGFDHVQGSQSIMYYLNIGKDFILSKQDIAEYKRVCDVVK